MVSSCCVLLIKAEREMFSFHVVIARNVITYYVKHTDFINIESVGMQLEIRKMGISS